MMYNEVEVSYFKQLRKFKSHIVDYAQSALKFYDLLIDNRPKFSKLYAFGYRMICLHDIIELEYARLEKLIPYEKETCRLFSDFLHYVTFDNFKAATLIKEMNMFSYSLGRRSASFDKKTENSNLLIISTDPGKIGSIIDCNHNFASLVGIYKSKIIGTSLIEYIPKCIRQHMANFVSSPTFQSNVSEYEGSECSFFIKHFSGLVFPVDIKYIQSESAKANETLILSITPPKAKSGIPLSLLVNSADYIEDYTSSAFSSLHLPLPHTFNGIHISTLISNFDTIPFGVKTLVKIANSTTLNSCTCYIKEINVMNIAKVKEVKLHILDTSVQSISVSKQKLNNENGNTHFVYSEDLHVFMRDYASLLTLPEHSMISKVKSILYISKNVKSKCSINDNSIDSKTPSTESFYMGYISCSIKGLKKEIQKVSDSNSNKMSYFEDLVTLEGKKIFTLKEDIEVYRFSGGKYEPIEKERPLQELAAIVEGESTRKGKSSKKYTKLEINNIKEEFTHRLLKMPILKSFIFASLIAVLYFVSIVISLVFEYVQHNSMLTGYFRYIEMLNMTMLGSNCLMRTIYNVREVLLTMKYMHD